MDYLEEFWRSLKEGILEKCSLENFVQIFVIKKRSLWSLSLKFHKLILNESFMMVKWRFYKTNPQRTFLKKENCKH